MLENFDHTVGQKLTPHDYVKFIEEADKAFDLLGAENAAAHGDIDINTMLSQIHGTLSAENEALTMESGPRVTTEFAERVINDKIPIFMDGIFFKLNIRESKKAAGMNRKTTRQ